MSSTFTAGDVIRLARGRHVAFDEQAHPDDVAFDFLDAHQRELSQRLALVDDELLSTALVTSLPLAVFASGITLPVHSFIKGATFRWTSGVEDLLLPLVPWEHRFDPQPFPFACLHAGALLLPGVASDWVNVTSITLHYIPEVGTIDGTGDVFTLPDMTKSALVTALAVFFGDRALSMGVKVNMDGLLAAAGRAEQTLLDTAAMRRRAESDYVREVV